MSDDRKYRHRGYQDSDRDEPRPRTPQGGQGGQGGPSGGSPRLEGGPRGRTAGMPSDVVFKCAKCGEKVQTALAEVAADATCARCGAALHSCTNCAFFDTGAPFECRKPLPARVESKTAVNRCEHFQPKAMRDLSVRSPAKPDDARSAFDALFKK